jgi:hypothetical protein
MKYRKYETLKIELLSDPLGRGYSGMSDQEAADDLNTAYRSRDRRDQTWDIEKLIPNTERLAWFIASQSTDPAYVPVVAFWHGWQAALSSNALFNMQSPTFQEAMAMMGPNGFQILSQSTIDAINALSIEYYTRAEELNLPLIKTHYVTTARSM